MVVIDLDWSSYLTSGGACMIQKSMLGTEIDAKKRSYEKVKFIIIRVHLLYLQCLLPCVCALRLQKSFRIQVFPPRPHI